MTLTVLPTGYVSDEFEYPHGDVVFRDALVMTESEYAALTATEINDMKLRRFADWVAVVSAPSDQETIDG